MDTSTDTLPIHSKAVTIKCVAYLQEKVTFREDILPHLHLEWVGPNGVQLVSDSTVTVGEQRIESGTIVKNLTFNSLNYSHSGQYMCRSTLNTGSELVTAENNYTLIISSKPQSNQGSKCLCIVIISYFSNQNRSGSISTKVWTT